MGLTKPRAAQIFNLDYKQATRVVTVANITLSGGAPAVVDGVTLAEDDRVLVTAQSTGTQNGLYIVSAVGTGSNGTWARTSDGNETGEIEAGMIVMVTEGTVYADTQWKLITDNPIVIGTTALTFTQNYSANSISGGTSNVAVYSNANVTISSAGTANVLTVSSTGVVVTGTVSATGNITGNYILGNGSQLSGVITTVNANTLTGNTLSSNVVNSSLTSVGTLGSLSVTGNITSGNISATNHTGTTVSVTGTVTGASLTGTITTAAQTNITSVGTLGSLSVTGNATVGNLSATNITGTLSTAAQTNITSVGTLGSLSVTGNVNSGNLRTVGQISATGTITSAGGTNGTAFAVGNSAVSNVALGMFPTAGTSGEYAIRDYSNVFTHMYLDAGIGGTANGAFKFRTTNAFTTLANINSTGITTPLAISATGNVTGNYFIGNGSQLTGISAGSSSSISNGTSNVVVAASGNVTVGVAGTTAVATFYTAGIVANSIAATNNGNATNFKVGDDAWLGDINTADTIGIRGQQNAANAYIVFGNADNTQLGRAGSGPLTYAGAFSTTGNITGGNLSGTNITGTLATAAQTNITSVGTLSSLSVSGNVQGGNLRTAGLISATGTVTGSSLTGTITTAAQTNITSVGTLSSLSVTGNVAAGNVSGTNLTGTLATAAQTNITSVGTLGSLSVTGNITAGNISATNHTGTTVSVTGTVTGASLVGTVTTASQTNITSVGALGSLSVTGNITAGNLLLSGFISDSTQLDIQTSAANANIVLTPNGTGNVNTGANLSVTGNVQGGNLRTAGLISATGTVTGSSLTGTITTAAQTNITSVGTLSSLSVTGNVQGGNLRTAGLISATGAITGAAITGSSLTVSTGNVSAGNIVNNNANGVGNIGSATTYFNTVFAKATSAQYADLAENYEADCDYSPGTVVVFGGLKEITVTSNSHNTAVAGVISTNPSYLMNADQSGEWILPVALTGRVPCRVQGPVNKGTVLVTGDIPGTAIALDKAKFEPGCVVGKSLEIINSTDVLTIEVAVGRL